MRALSTVSLLLATTLGLAACIPSQPSNGAASASSAASSMTSSTTDTEALLQKLNVKNGDTLTSGMFVTGEARGNWYFEGSFPVRLVDERGATLAQTTAQAQGEWMTEDFVPFSAQLTFTTTAKNGTLILRNDNPSGMPENDKILEISVVF